MGLVIILFFVFLNILVSNILVFLRFSKVLGGLERSARLMGNNPPTLYFTATVELHIFRPKNLFKHVVEHNIFLGTMHLVRPPYFKSWGKIMYNLEKVREA